MANLTCFSIPGMKLWFYSNDHQPPHFHAKRKGKWEVRIEFLETPDAMFDIVWRKTKRTTISAQDKAVMIEMVEGHRFELLTEWQQKVNRS